MNGLRIICGACRKTWQGAVMPGGIYHRRIGRVFQRYLGASSLVGGYLRQRLIAARISYRPNIVHHGIVKIRFRKPRLIREQFIHQLHQA